MKQIFLTSSVDMVAQDIANKLPADQRELVFVITASEDETGDVAWRDDDRNALIKAGFQVTDYTFTGQSAAGIEQTLNQFDVLCIEGGNTFWLLEQIQKTGCADIIRRAVEGGMSYIGSSAGSIVAGPNIYPLRKPGYDIAHMANFSGLGLVDFIVLPHWGSEHFKDLYLNHRVALNYNDEYKRIFLSDNQYIQTDGEVLRLIDVSR